MKLNIFILPFIPILLATCTNATFVQVLQQYEQQQIITHNSLLREFPNLLPYLTRELQRNKKLTMLLEKEYLQNPNLFLQSCHFLSDLLSKKPEPLRSRGHFQKLTKLYLRKVLSFAANHRTEQDPITVLESLSKITSLLNLPLALQSAVDIDFAAIEKTSAFIQSIKATYKDKKISTLRILSNLLPKEKKGLQWIESIHSTNWCIELFLSGQKNPLKKIFSGLDEINFLRSYDNILKISNILQLDSKFHKALLLPAISRVSDAMVKEEVPPLLSKIFEITHRGHLAETRRICPFKYRSNITHITQQTQNKFLPQKVLFKQLYGHQTAKKPCSISKIIQVSPIT